jgi:sterol desaturase/sphingolipid hydroxylase (fatty acid hydroxylase superfamily)
MSDQATYPRERGEPTDVARRAPARSVRLFESDLLERLTRTRLATLVLFWVPVSGGLLFLGVRQGQLSGMEIGGIAAAGVAAWTLFEYVLHRLAFHLDRWISAAARFCFLMHGCHHADPSDAGRDIMPLIGSVPIFGMVLGVAIGIFGDAGGAVFGSAFGSAYLAYDVVHYGCHQWPLPGRLGAYLKRHHLIHHFLDDACNFGVTSPLWDWIFGTRRVSGRS